MSRDNIFIDLILCTIIIIIIIIIIIKNFIKKSVSQYRNNNNNKITSAGAKVLNLHNSHNNLTQCDYLSIKTN